MLAILLAALALVLIHGHAEGLVQKSDLEAGAPEPDRILAYLQGKIPYENYCGLKLLRASPDTRYIHHVAGFLESDEIAYIPDFAPDDDILAGIQIGFSLARLNVMAAAVLRAMDTEESFGLLEAHIKKTGNEAILEYLQHPEVNHPRFQDIHAEASAEETSDMQGESVVENKPSTEESSEFDVLNEDIHSPALMGIGANGHTRLKFGARTGRGRGRAIRRTGGQGTHEAVALALQWLAAHQDEDGKWDGAKSKDGSHTGAVTGLATLAFLANGHTPSIGQYKDVTNHAVTWIAGTQQPDGHYSSYHDAAGITLLAMAEAYGMSSGAPRAPWQRNVQKAVDAAVAAQGEDGGWHDVPGATGGCLPVSAWWMMALHSAKEADLDVPEAVFDRARIYWTNSAIKVGELEGESLYAGRYRPGQDRVTALSTSILLCGRQFLGYPQEDPIVQGAARVLLGERQDIANWRGGNNILPGRRTGEGAGSQDFYAWSYQALGFFQLGPHSEAWQTFNPLMKKELVQTQRKDGSPEEYRGSWDPNDGGYHGAGQWGRVGQTATGALMLSVYYRYASVHPLYRRRR